jgi:[NiFe] hydrogenase assembly HybE family chaperone
VRAVCAATLLTLVTFAQAQTVPLRLLVWINGDKGYNGLQKVGDEFTKVSGVQVVVQHPEGAPDKFQAAAAAGKGPDIMCWPHDRVGEWAQSGLIVPLRPSRRLRAEIDDTAWNAFTYRKQVWGYPLAIEAVGFREHERRQVGVIVTPWFMNLTVLPSGEDLKMWVAGGSVRLGFPSGAYDFVVSDLEGVGLIGACSLFSTMFEFTDHEAAQLAAQTVADAVFEPEQPAPAPAVSRRQLLGG